MIEQNETLEKVKPKHTSPILQLNRLQYVKVSGKILDSTGERLEKYIRYASERMNVEVTAGDCLEHALKLLFDRDSGFKTWLKEN